MAKKSAGKHGVDLKALDREQLIQLEKDVKRALRDYDRRIREEALTEMDKVAQKYGVSMKELFKQRASRASAPVKFRHPENSSLTWSGRGRQPSWFRDALAAGIAEDDLRSA